MKLTFAFAVLIKALTLNNRQLSAKSLLTDEQLNHLNSLINGYDALTVVCIAVGVYSSFKYDGIKDHPYADELLSIFEGVK